MGKQREDLTRGVPLPSTWVNSLMEFVGGLSPNLSFSLADATTLEIPAGPNNDQVALAIGHGAWRWISASITAAHPGGAAGLYDVWATAHENDFSLVDPADATNYSFAMTIRAAGDPPDASGATALSRLIANVLWDGSAITAIYPLVGAPAHAAAHRIGAPDAIVDLPTAAQKAALAGTDGTPGSDNRYVTETAPRMRLLGVKALPASGGKISTVPKSLGTLNPSHTAGRAVLVVAFVPVHAVGPSSSVAPSTSVHLLRAGTVVSVVKGPERTGVQQQDATVTLGFNWQATGVNPVTDGHQLWDVQIQSTTSTSTIEAMEGGAMLIFEGV